MLDALAPHLISGDVVLVGEIEPLGGDLDDGIEDLALRGLGLGTPVRHGVAARHVRHFTCTPACINLHAHVQAKHWRNLVRPQPIRPQRVARDAWLVSELFPAGDGVHVPVRSLVLTGAQPVIVDTGTSHNRHAWTEAVWSIVDPRDVRWVFLSHDDADHVGNVLEVLAACPNATLVTNWFATERLAGDLPLPLHRMRWLDHGATLDVGDRVLHLVRPPIFDSPTTRGLFDPGSGVYWAADACASVVTPDVLHADDLDEELWEGSFRDMNRAISPWHELLDTAKYGRFLQQLAAMPATAVVGAHGAVLRDDRIRRAYEILARLPDLGPVELPGQALLDALIAGASVAPAA
jgi:hypothetical protein